MGKESELHVLLALRYVLLALPLSRNRDRFGVISVRIRERRKGHLTLPAAAAGWSCTYFILPDRWAGMT